MNEKDNSLPQPKWLTLVSNRMHLSLKYTSFSQPHRKPICLQLWEGREFIFGYHSLDLDFCSSWQWWHLEQTEDKISMMWITWITDHLRCLQSDVPLKTNTPIAPLLKKNATEKKWEVFKSPNTGFPSYEATKYKSS